MKKLDELLAAEKESETKEVHRCPHAWAFTEAQKELLVSAAHALTPKVAARIARTAILKALDSEMKKTKSKRIMEDSNENDQLSASRRIDSQRPLES